MVNMTHEEMLKKLRDYVSRNEAVFESRFPTLEDKLKILEGIQTITEPDYDLSDIPQDILKSHIKLASIYLCKDLIQLLEELED